MKKLFSLMIILITLCCFVLQSYAQSQSSADPSNKNSISSVTIYENPNLNTVNIKDNGFKTVILSCSDVRISKKPYRTDFKSLKTLDKNIKELEGNKLNFILDISSGPGLSSNGKVSSIFENKLELLYFTKMVREIIKRYENNSYFKGISVSLNTPDISEDKYYTTLNSIISSIQKDAGNLNILYNLHPLTFENDFKNLPEIENKYVLLNLTIGLKGLSYPGFGAGYKTSYNLNKNEILSRLEKFKEYEKKEKLKGIITLRTPWAQNSEILMQDTFEILKILGMDYNLCYANTGDIYDFTRNEAVMKVIRRHIK